MTENQHDETKALLKIHFGNAFKHDSDSESVVSIASDDSYLERFRPPPYRYEDIQSRVIIVEAGPSSASKSEMETSKSGDKHLATFQNAMEKKLNALMQENYCSLCETDLVDNITSSSHYSSKKHRKNFNAWCLTEIENAKKTQEWCGLVGTIPPFTLMENLMKLIDPRRDHYKYVVEKMDPAAKEKELRSVLTLNHCFICDATLPNLQTSAEHYNSKRHRHLVSYWFGNELFEKSRTFDMSEHINNVSCSNSESAESNSLMNSDVDEAIDNKLKSLTLPYYCHVCQLEIKSLNDGVCHYNSKKHAKSVKIWQQAEKDKAFGSHSINTNEESVIGSKQIEENGTNNSRNRQDNSKKDGSNDDVDNSTRVESKAIDKNRIEDVIHPDYCDICEVDLKQSKTIFLHYTSKEHAEATIVWRKKLDDTAKESENDSIATIEKSFQIVGLTTLNMQQIRDFHDNLTTDFSEDLKERLYKLLGSQRCEVCDTALQDENSAKIHYLSKRHGKNVQRWCSPAKTSGPTEQMPSNKDIHSSQSSLNSDSSSVTSYCHLCKFTFETNSNQHVFSFAHQELLKLAITLIKKGLILQDYWFKLFSKLICNKKCDLCNESFATNRIAIEHSFSESHRNQVNYWIRQYEHYSSEDGSEAFDKKVCYCESCEKELDGTSRTAKHYTGLLHLSLLHTYCQICKLQLRYTNKYREHNETLHSKKSSTTPPSNESNEKHAQNEDIKTDTKVQADVKVMDMLRLGQERLTKTLNESISKLDKDVSDELKKLADAVYFSKKIPLDVALEYLKKFNNEIDVFKAKIETNNKKKLAEDVAKNEEKSIKNVNAKPDSKGKVLTDHQENATKINTKQKTNLNQESKARSDEDFPVQDPTTTQIKTEEKQSDLNQESKAQKLEDTEVKNYLPHEDVQIQDPTITEAKVAAVETIETNRDNLNDTCQNLTPKSGQDETAAKLGIMVLYELSKLVNSINDGFLEQSVIKSCLKKFNEELEDYSKGQS